MKLFLAVVIGNVFVAFALRYEWPLRYAVPGILAVTVVAAYCGCFDY